MRGSRVTHEFLRRMNIDMKNSPIDLNEVVRKMLSNYVNILFNERLAEKYELLCCIDIKGTFIYNCPNHFNVMGYEFHELCGVNGFDIIHPEDVEKMQFLLVEMLNNHQPKELVYRISHKQGFWINMRSICTPYIVDGEVAALINFSNRCEPYDKNTIH